MQSRYFLALFLIYLIASPSHIARAQEASTNQHLANILLTLNTLHDVIRSPDQNSNDLFKKMRMFQEPDLLVLKLKNLTNFTSTADAIKVVPDILGTVTDFLHVKDSSDDPEGNANGRVLFDENMEEGVQRPKIDQELFMKLHQIGMHLHEKHGEENPEFSKHLGPLLDLIKSQTDPAGRVLLEEFDFDVDFSNANPDLLRKKVEEILKKSKMSAQDTENVAKHAQEMTNHPSMNMEELMKHVSTVGKGGRTANTRKHLHEEMLNYQNSSETLQPIPQIPKKEDSRLLQQEQYDPADESDTSNDENILYNSQNDSIVTFLSIVAKRLQADFAIASGFPSSTMSNFVNNKFMQSSLNIITLALQGSDPLNVGVLKNLIYSSKLFTGVEDLVWNALVNNQNSVCTNALNNLKTNLQDNYYPTLPKLLYIFDQTDCSLGISDPVALSGIVARTYALINYPEFFEFFKSQNLAGFSNAELINYAIKSTDQVLQAQIVVQQGFILTVLQNMLTTSQSSLSWTKPVFRVLFVNSEIVEVASSDSDNLNTTKILVQLPKGVDIQLNSTLSFSNVTNETASSTYDTFEATLDTTLAQAQTITNQLNMQYLLPLFQNASTYRQALLIESTNLATISNADKDSDSLVFQSQFSISPQYPDVYAQLLDASATVSKFTTYPLLYIWTLSPTSSPSQVLFGTSTLEYSFYTVDKYQVALKVIDIYGHTSLSSQTYTTSWNHPVYIDSGITSFYTSLPLTTISTEFDTFFQSYSGLFIRIEGNQFSSTTNFYYNSASPNLPLATKFHVKPLAYGYQSLRAYAVDRVTPTNNFLGRWGYYSTDKVEASCNSVLGDACDPNNSLVALAAQWYLTGVAGTSYITIATGPPNPTTKYLQEDGSFGTAPWPNPYTNQLGFWQMQTDDKSIPSKIAKLQSGDPPQNIPNVPIVNLDNLEALDPTNIAGELTSYDNAGTFSFQRVATPYYRLKTDTTPVQYVAANNDGSSLILVQSADVDSYDSDLLTWMFVSPRTDSKANINNGVLITNQKTNKCLIPGSAHLGDCSKFPDDTCYDLNGISFVNSTLRDFNNTCQYWDAYQEEIITQRVLYGVSLLTMFVVGYTCPFPPKPITLLSKQTLYFGLFILNGVFGAGASIYTYVDENPFIGFALVYGSTIAGLLVSLLAIALQIAQTIAEVPLGFGIFCFQYYFLVILVLALIAGYSVSYGSYVTNYKKIQRYCQGNETFSGKRGQLRDPTHLSDVITNSDTLLNYIQEGDYAIVTGNGTCRQIPSYQLEWVWDISGSDLAIIQQNKMDALSLDVGTEKSNLLLTLRSGKIFYEKQDGDPLWLPTEQPTPMDLTPVYDPSSKTTYIPCANGRNTPGFVLQPHDPNLKYMYVAVAKGFVAKQGPAYNPVGWRTEAYIQSDCQQVWNLVQVAYDYFFIQGIGGQNSGCLQPTSAIHNLPFTFCVDICDTLPDTMWHIKQI